MREEDMPAPSRDWCWLQSGKVWNHHLSWSQVRILPCSATFFLDQVLCKLLWKYLLLSCSFRIWYLSQSICSIQHNFYLKIPGTRCTKVCSQARIYHNPQLSFRLHHWSDAQVYWPSFELNILCRKSSDIPLHRCKLLYFH